MKMSPVCHCCARLLRQTSLAMFRSKAFTVRRRYSDFLGLHEKLAVKQSLQGCIIPPPPEKSVVGGFPPPGLLKPGHFSDVRVFFFFYSRLNQQEWPKWRWEWTTRRLWSLWRGEELDWRGKCPFMFLSHVCNGASGNWTHFHESADRTALHLFVPYL